MAKYWITKWALTRGVIVADCRPSSVPKYVRGPTRMGGILKIDHDAFASEAEARDRVIELARAAAAKAEKEYLRLQDLRRSLQAGGPLPADKRAKESKS